MASILAKLSKEWNRTLSRLRRGPRTPAEKRAEWESRHQPFELNFHRGENYRWDDAAFSDQWNEIFGGLMGLTPRAFCRGEVLLDLGCGSRPVLDWFTGNCERHFLDPLLDRFRDIPQMKAFWAGKSPATLHAQPAEELARNLAGKCDFVNCWNVLDHTYDWRAILSNIAEYARPGGLVCLGTDFQGHGDGHPGIDDRAGFDAFIDQHFQVRASRANFVHRELALQLVKI
jgi:hypothetical protein